MKATKRDENPTSQLYDVVICGGGLAGLTLARQLRLTIPEASIALIERTPRPLPEAAHKVGESSVEVGAHYFGKVLELEDYFDERHLPKLGLRFFLGDSSGPFEDRPELGPSVFAPAPSYQIDRGRLENDLRDMIEQMGVQLFEGSSVKDIVLSDDDQPHQVLFRKRNGQEEQVLQGRWVVDAMSRRRFLQNKLELKRDSGHQASSAWWRIPDRVDIEQLTSPAGHRRRPWVVEDRNLSTNHMMGHGYWVWLIPLSSGHTSVGIVTDETIHPFRTYGRSYEQAIEWLEQHEPHIAALIGEYEPCDFHGLRNYSYHSRQVFSHDRWSCVGEAGIFADPFYSPGSDFICVANTFTTTLIRRDLAGTLTAETVDAANHLYLDLIADIFLHTYRDTYSTFGHCHIFTAKHVWDAALYFALLSQIVFQGMLERLDRLPQLLPICRRYKELHERMQRLFVDWAAMSPSREPYRHLDMAAIPLLQMLFVDLKSTKTADQLIEVLQLNLNQLEELAQLVFFQAVEECYPEELERIPKPRWVNAWGISLHPDAWEADGLFAPTSKPRSLRLTKSNLRGIFAPPSLIESINLTAARLCRRFLGGKPYYAFVRFFLRWFVENHSGRYIRRIFVNDRYLANQTEFAPQPELQPVEELAGSELKV